MLPLSYRIFLLVFLQVGFFSTDTLFATPTVEEIHADLKAWREKFATIQVEYYSWAEQDVIDYVPGFVPGDPIKGVHGTRHDFAWADFGAYYTKTDFLSDGDVEQRNYRGNDSLRPWDAKTLREKPDHWFAIRLWKPIESGRPESHWMVESMYGLYDTRVGMWLPDMMMRDHVEDIRIESTKEDVGDVVMTIYEGTLRIEFLLKRELNWLPISRTDWAKSSDSNEFKKSWVWKAAYREWLPGVHLPESGTIQLRDIPPVKTFTVEQVVLNEPLTRQDFGPPEPDIRTKLYDHVTGEFHWHGAKKQAKPKGNLVSSQANSDRKKDIALPGNTIGYIRWILSILGVLALVSGLYFRFR